MEGNQNHSEKKFIECIELLRLDCIQPHAG